MTTDDANVAGTQDRTWNPVTGCDRVSPGCDNCYALGMAARLKSMGVKSYQNDGDPRTSGPGFGLTLHPERLGAPLRWRKPATVFVTSMSDLFHARVPFEFVQEVWGVMEQTPRHNYQILTKRPDRMARFSRRLPLLPNVWLGTSVEDQERTERLHWLVETQAQIRFVTAEPLLGPLDLTPWLDGGRIHWLATGGESGPGARPAQWDWFRSLRDQCVSAGVPFYFHQAGSVLAGGRDRASGASALLEGRRWMEMPV